MVEVVWVGGNILEFTLDREYTDFAEQPAGDKLEQINTQVHCTLTVLHNGVANFLAEEADRRRFRVRDVPGVLSQSVFKNQQTDSLSDLSFEVNDNDMILKFTHTYLLKNGYEQADDKEISKNYEIAISLNNFGLWYKVNDEIQLQIEEGSFVFETAKDEKLI